MQTEIWKELNGYQGIYEISNLGNIKSLEREYLIRGKYPFKLKEKQMKLCPNNKGYYVVTLSKNGTQKVREVHQLVAETFLYHVPCGYELVVDHKNQLRTDNRVENLQIITQRKNADKKHIKSSSEYVGVSWKSKNKKWTAQITINKKRIYLGLFDTEIEAHNAYQNKLKEQ